MPIGVFGGKKAKSGLFTGSVKPKSLPAENIREFQALTTPRRQRFGDRAMKKITNTISNK